MAFCSQCGRAARGSAKFCAVCGAALELDDAPSPSPPPASAPAVKSPEPRPLELEPTAARAGSTPAPAVRAPAADGRPHSPGVALTAAFVIPGAGQAYNGQPVKGFFLLFASFLLLPQIYALIDAWSTGVKIRDGGGRFGMGGPVWIVLQTWLWFNVLAFGALLLSMFGVLS